ncbi:ATP-binding protein [Nocardioides sp.]|uniref:ATP-binding protein n=1 Tax=Nocardioides sp. TaxID=35761 RepID=UPI001A236EAE|nr:ATP-binding protein [Nocardioides sp.]MBJ7357139.1 PAS domain S-box protein [Nocardioides sp.]
MASPDPRRSWALSFALLLGAYAAGVGAVLFAPEGSPVATFWPASAFTVPALALATRRRWVLLVPAVFLVSVATNLTGGRAVEVSLGFGLANTAEGVVAALVLTAGLTRPPRLSSQEDVLRLLATAAAGAAVIGLIAATTVELAGTGTFLTTLRSTAASHAAALVTLLPVALLVGQKVGRWTAEHSAQLMMLVALTLLIFAPSGTLIIALPPLVALTWGALRLGIRVLSFELAGFALVVSLLNAQGRGPFAIATNGGAEDVLAAGAATQLFLLCAAVITLPLAVAALQSEVLLDRVRADELIFRRNFTESLVGMVFLAVEEVPASPDGDDDEVGLDLRIVDLNDTAVEILGGDRQHLVDASLLDLVELDDDFGEALEGTLAGERDGWQADVPLIGSRAGHVTMALSRLSEVSDEPLLAAQLLDVTSEHEARRSLEIAERLTSTTLDTAACIIMVTGLDGTVLRVNKATSEITGYPASHLIGRPVWELGLVPADAEDIAALLMWPNRSGVPVAREADALTRSGEKLRIVWNTNIVHDDQGASAFAVMTGIDVTAERATAGLVNHLMEASFTTALVGVDTGGRISVVNSGTEHLLGFDRHELVGTPFVDLLKSSELLERTGADSPEEAFAILVRGLGHDGETKARDWTWVNKDGADQLVSMTLSVSQDDLAARSGYLCVARDVSEQRHSQEMLIAALDKERTAVERLRALDQAKNEFVSTVSHELRTPVTSIVGYVEMLRDGEVAEPLPAQVPLLDTIDRNGQRLISMINDLLMLSGFDSDNVQWRHDPVDLVETLRPVEDAVRPLLRDRDLKLIIRPPGRPVRVTGDRAQLERVMINLLSNAVKFTEDGGEVELLLTEERGEAVLKVSDTGIGIPIDEQDELFQRFFRASTAQHRQIQGTGLGLSIVAAIVQGHGGRIEVDSAHLQGSTFTVRIPLARLHRLTHSA